MIDLPKIITAQQTKKADAFTIRNKPIASIDLMERASSSFVQEFLKHAVTGKKIAVVCGVGNNGGDGLAITRILKEKGVEVHPFLIQFANKLTPDCQTNFDRLKNVSILKSDQKIPGFHDYDIIIDALLGSGLNKPVNGFIADIIKTINRSGRNVCSVDIPSGLFCDKITTEGTIIESDLVISFQRPKLAFFFPENNAFIKDWKVVDIGLDESFIQQQQTSHFVLDHQISECLKTRERYSHKGTYGHALLIAGSYGKMGAAVLAAKSCMRSGVGLLTTYVPKCGYEILQTTVPEAMCLTDVQHNYLSVLPNLENFNAVGVGPGLGTHPDTAHVIESLFERATAPLVLDADALNILSAKLELIAKIPKNTVLTPHIKEFDRLAGFSVDAEERFEKQQKFSVDHQCIVVLKDAHTSVSDIDGNLYFNTSGNPGMATGGSGDVLTGIITGLLAQNYSPLEAALIGVYSHGAAGDTAAKERGQNGLIASDIIDHLYI